MDGDGRKANSLRNIAAGFLYRIVGLLLPFIIRTLFINCLGEAYLGLNSLLTSVLNVLNLTEFGFANAITYKMYQPAAVNDTKRLSELLSVYRKIYRIIGILILIGGGSLIPVLPKLIKDGCPDSVNLYLVYMVYLVNSALSYLLFSYRGTLFSAYQRLDIQSVINTSVLLVSNVFQVVVLVCVRDYYAYVFLMPLFTVINNVMVYMVTKKRFPRVVGNLKVDKGVYFAILKSAGAMFGHKLNYVIVSAADNIVISSFLGLVLLAKYGNYFTILSAVMGFMDTVIQALLPSVGNLLVEGNAEKNTRMFHIMSFAQYWFTGWCSICLACMYQPFMCLWMGEEMLLDMGIVLLLALYLYSYKARAVVLLFKDAAGMWSADLLKPYVSALCNIALNILLVKIIGLYGVIVSTIVVFLFINFPWESFVLIKRFSEVSIERFMANFVLCLIVFLLTGCATYQVCGLVRIEGIAGLLIRTSLCVVVPNCIIAGCFWKRKEVKEMREILCTVWRGKRIGR